MRCQFFEIKLQLGHAKHSGPCHTDRECRSTRSTDSRHQPKVSRSQNDKNKNACTAMRFSVLSEANRLMTKKLFSSPDETEYCSLLSVKLVSSLIQILDTFVRLQVKSRPVAYCLYNFFNNTVLTQICPCFLCASKAVNGAVKLGCNKESVSGTARYSDDASRTIAAYDRTQSLTARPAGCRRRVISRLC